MCQYTQDYHRVVLLRQRWTEIQLIVYKEIKEGRRVTQQNISNIPLLLTSFDCMHV